jgi:hypothetical protein
MTSDLSRVESVAIAVAREVVNAVEGGVIGAEPFRALTPFRGKRIDFNVVLRIQKFEAQFFIKHEFIKRLRNALPGEDIEISVPIGQ